MEDSPVTHSFEGERIQGKDLKNHKDDPHKNLKNVQEPNTHMKWSITSWNSQNESWRFLVERGEKPAKVNPMKVHQRKKRKKK